MRLLFVLLTALVATVWAGPPDALVVNTLGKNDSYIPVEDPCIKSPCVLINEPSVELRYRNYTSFGIEEVYQSDTFTVSFRSLNHTVPLFFMFLDKKGFEMFEAGDDTFPYYTGSIIPTPYPNASPEDLVVEERTFKLTRYFDSLFVVFSNESPLSTEVAHCDYQVSLSYQGLGCVTYFFVVLAIPVCLVAIMLMVCIGPCYRRCCNKCDPHGVRHQHAAYYEARRQRVRARERARLEETARRRAAASTYQSMISQGKTVAEATVAAEAAGAAAVATARARRPLGSSIPPSPMSRPLSRSASGSVPLTPTVYSAGAGANVAGATVGSGRGYGTHLPPGLGAPLLTHGDDLSTTTAAVAGGIVSADHDAHPYPSSYGTRYNAGYSTGTYTDGFTGSSFGGSPFTSGRSDHGGSSGSGNGKGTFSLGAAEVDWEAEAAARSPEDETIADAAKEARRAGGNGSPLDNGVPTNGTGTGSGAGAGVEAEGRGYVSPGYGSVASLASGPSALAHSQGQVSPTAAAYGHFAGTHGHPAHGHPAAGSSRRYVSSGGGSSAASDEHGANMEDIAAASKASAPAYFQYDFSEDENAVYVQPATCWYCCVYRPYQFTHPVSVNKTWCPAAGRCRLPYPRCCPSLYYFTGRPLTDYWHWWRQRALITWPWNPLPDEDIIKFRHRLMLVITVLAFNLLVLTRWAALFGLYNKSVTARFANIPVVGRYFVLYIGASIIQDVFTALMRPVLAFTLHVAPKLKRSSNPIIRGAGFIAYYLGVGLALTLVILVAFNIVELAERYRCWVLQTQVLLPFLVIHIARMFFVFAVVPLPVFYHLQSAYGAMIPPGIDVRTGDLYPDKARRLASAYPYGHDDDDVRSVRWRNELERAEVGGDPALLEEFAAEEAAAVAREMREREERRRRSSAAAAAEVAAASRAGAAGLGLELGLSSSSSGIGGGGGLAVDVGVPSGASPGSAGSVQNPLALSAHGHSGAHGHSVFGQGEDVGVGEAAARMFSAGAGAGAGVGAGAGADGAGAGAGAGGVDGGDDANGVGDDDDDDDATSGTSSLLASSGAADSSASPAPAGPDAADKSKGKGKGKGRGKKGAPAGGAYSQM